MVQLSRLRFSGSANPKSHGALRKLLLLAFVHGLSTPVESVNGVIWDKKTNDFVPIVSKPIFAAINQEFLNRSRAMETYNFQGKTFRFSYYEMGNIVKSDKNRTRVTGYIGDAWNILAEYLNFTLKLQYASIRSLGYPINNTFTPGLLKSMYLNQTDIIARVVGYRPTWDTLQLTIPFKTARYSLMVRPISTYNTTWMLQLFSKKVWVAILVTYIVLTACSYVFRVIEADIFGENMDLGSMIDSFFYSLSMMCNQYGNSNTVSRSTRIIEYVMALFALIINSAFNALVIGYMTQVVTITPFHDVKSIMETTQYTVMVIKGSMLDMLFELKYLPDHSSKSKKKRVIMVKNLNEADKKLCSKELVTMYLSDEMRVSRRFPCKLQALDNPALILVSSGVSLYMKNKRSIDIGLLKLYEYGILNAIKRNWLGWRKEVGNVHVTEAVVMEQVYFIYFVLFGGMFISVIILILEHIAFYCDK